jgi:hypothetical protein
VIATLVVLEHRWPQRFRELMEDRNAFTQWRSAATGDRPASAAASDEERAFAAFVARAPAVSSDALAAYFDM